MLKRILSVMLIATLMLSAGFSNLLGNLDEASAATTAKITKSTRVTAGGESATYVYDVGDMHGACCQKGNERIPLKGQNCTLTELSQKNLMTKIAYVAHEEGFSKKGSVYKYCVARALARANGTCAKNKYSHAGTVNRIYNKALKTTVPENFIAYKANPTNGGQDFVCWKEIPYGYLTIKKGSTDRDSLGVEGYTLKGAEFTVYNTAGKKVGKLTTDSAGKTKELKLLPAKYKVKETKAPDGYKKSKDTEVVIIESNEEYRLEIENTPIKSTVKIKKTNKSGSSAGFKFRIRSDSGYNKVHTTDADGNIKVTNLAGTYTVSEELTTAQINQGYIKQPVQKITVLPGKTATFKFVNEIEKPILTLYKTSDTDVVAGFKFYIKNTATGTTLNNGNPYITKVDPTNSKRGIITVELDPGKYEIWEELTDVQATGGYTAANPQKITIKAGQNAIVKFHNIWTPREDYISIVKRTTDGGSPAGFKFSIEGIFDDAKTVTADELVTKSAPTVSNMDDYDISDFIADTDDVNDINVAAKNGDTGNYEAKLSAVANLKITAPTAPEITDITETEAKLTWTAAPGAEKYEVYRAEEKAGVLSDYTKIAEVTDEELLDSAIDHTDADLTFYQYKVKAVKDSLTSDFSEGIKLVKQEVTDPLTDAYWSTEAGDAYEGKENTKNLFYTLSAELLPVNTEVEDIPASVPNSDGDISWHDIFLAISGTKFYIEDITDSFGRLNTSELKAGTYKITEIMTDEQKLRYHEPESQTVTLDDGGNTVRVTFENVAREGDIKIVKTAVDGKIEGIEFTITGTTAWGDEIEEVKLLTDENGVITHRLPAGEFYVEETGLDKALYVPQEKQKVTITGDETEPIEVRFHNIPYDGIEIHKRSSEDDSKNLVGAHLQIIHKDTGAVVHDFITTEEAYVADKLRKGDTYIVHEVEAPDGFVVAPDMEFVAGDLPSIIMYDDPTTLFVTKIDADTAKFLNGAGFEIIDPDTNEKVLEFDISMNEESNEAQIEVSKPEAVTEEQLAETNNEIELEQQQSLLFSTLNMMAADMEITKQSAGTLPTEVNIATASDEEELEKILPESYYAAIRGLIDGKLYVIREIRTPQGYTTMEEMTFIFSEGMHLEIENSKPSISTFVTDTDPTIWDELNDENYATADDAVELVDTVQYENLNPGKYVLLSTFMDRRTGEPFIKSDGQPLTAETRFETTEKLGQVEVKFPAFDGTEFSGTQIVAYEELYDEAGNLVAEHTEIEDTAQLITILSPIGYIEIEDKDELLAWLNMDVMTGDNMNLIIPIAVLIIAAFGIIAAVSRRKKNSDNENVVNEE